MISEALAEAITGIWALVFLGSFAAFAGALIYYNERRWPRFTSICFDNVWVTAVMALFYGYQYFDGNTDYRWLAYALTCPFLLRTIHTYFTCPSKACLHGGTDAGQWALYATMGAIAVTMLFGFAITQVATTTAQWVLIGTGFVPFGFAIGMLYKAIEYRPAAVGGGMQYWALVLIGAGWLVFPVILPLSPVVTGTITFFDSVFAYAMGDLVAKVFATWYFAWRVRLQCGRCVPRAPKCVAHRRVACLKPQCIRPAHEYAHKTPALCEVHGIPHCPVCPADGKAYARAARDAYTDDYEAQPFYLAHHHQEMRRLVVSSDVPPPEPSQAPDAPPLPHWMRVRGVQIV